MVHLPLPTFLLLLTTLSTPTTACPPSTIRRGGDILLLNATDLPQLTNTLVSAQFEANLANVYKSFFLCSDQGNWELVHICHTGIVDIFNETMKIGETCAVDCTQAGAPKEKPSSQAQVALSGAVGRAAVPVVVVGVVAGLLAFGLA